MEKHIHGGDVYHHQGCIDFSANCNPLGTPEGIKKAIIKSLEHINDYPQVGCTPLKKAIAEYENTKPDQVICGNGAAEVIFSLCRAVNPRRALVPAPTFAEYQQALYSVDCQVEFFPLNGKKGFVLEEDFLQALTKEIDIIFLCNPNNPTGLLVEKTLLEKILKRCQELDILMAVDECFLDFVPSPEKYTLKEYLETYDNLFLLKAFTKRYAMAGVRLGYGLCGNKGLLEKNGRCMSALECLFHGTGGWSGGFAGKRICRKGKTGDLSGTGISERRTGGAWLSGLSFSGELRVFYRSGGFV